MPRSVDEHWESAPWLGNFQAMELIPIGIMESKWWGAHCPKKVPKCNVQAPTLQQ